MEVTTPSERRGMGTASLPLARVVSPFGSDTCHEKWAPGPDSALKFMGVYVETIRYLPCRPKSLVSFSGDWVTK